MARTNITAQVPPLNSTAGYYPATPLVAASADVTWTGTSDPTDRQTPIVENKTLLLARNAGTATYTITITSVLDAQNRVGDISGYAIAPGTLAMFGPFRSAGWASSGNLLIDVSNSNIQLAPITLP